MRRISEQVPKGATQQGRVAKSPDWTVPDYSIPQPSYLDRVPWTLNETTCEQEWRFAHGRGCLQLIQTFAKSEGQNLSHVLVPSEGAEFASTAAIHDYSPQGNHCQYSHQEQRTSTPQYHTGFRGASNWVPSSYTHEPSGRDSFDETDSVWSWRSKGKSLAGHGKQPKLVPARMVKWLGSTDDHYRGSRGEFTFHAYAYWQGRGNGKPDSCLFSLSKGTNDSYDSYLRIGQRQDGQIYARVMTDSSYYEDDEGDIESQLHYSDTDNLADARYHLISVVLDGNEQVKIFCDGQKLDITSTGVSDGFQEGNLFVPNDFYDETMWLCERSTVNSGAWLGGFAWGGLWGFAWDDNQIRKLSEDVYAPFRLRERSSLAVADPNVTLTMTTQVADWVVPAPGLTRSRTLSMTTQVADWVVPAPELARSRTLSMTTETADWVVPAPSLLGGQTLSMTTQVADWVVPAPGLSLGRVLSMTTQTADWVVPAPSLARGRTLSASTQVANWVVPAPALSSDQSLTMATVLAAWATPGVVIPELSIVVELDVGDLVFDTEVGVRDLVFDVEMNEDNLTF